MYPLTGKQKRFDSFNCPQSRKYERLIQLPAGHSYQ
jgi:hypothetical protein